MRLFVQPLRWVGGVRIISFFCGDVIKTFCAKEISPSRFPVAFGKPYGIIQLGM